MMELDAWVPNMMLYMQPGLVKGVLLACSQTFKAAVPAMQVSAYPCILTSPCSALLAIMTGKAGALCSACAL